VTIFYQLNNKLTLLMAALRLNYNACTCTFIQ